MSAYLTHRERELLEFLRAHVKTHGISPSYEEIMVEMGWRSKCRVGHWLTQLEMKGRIRRLDRRARSIEVLPDAGHHHPECVCDACNSARYVADLLLVEAMSQPAPAALLAVIAAQWDAAGEGTMPSIAQVF